MRGMLGRFSRWSVISAAAALLLCAPPPHAQDRTQLGWFQCSLPKSPYGDPVFYSSVFPADRGMGRDVGYENAFSSYVAARYDPNAISGAVCFGPYDDYQEAANTQNDQIAGNRRDGKRVVITKWVYRGE